MNIKIALTNLGKYNEGQLVFEWLELPATQEEIDETLESIGIDGVRYEEYFITDYEAPFKIEEYANLERLNNFVEELERIHGIEPILTGTYDAGDVINFAQETGYEEDVVDIVSDEMLDEIVANIAKDGGWQRVTHFLSGIDFMNDDYYILNGYGNAENMRPEYLENVIDDIMHELRSNHDM